MIANTTASWLALELRDINTHEVKYVTVSLNQKKLFKQEFFIEYLWWTGISAFQEHKLLLYKFDDSDNPAEKSYYLLDISTGDISGQGENGIDEKIDEMTQKMAEVKGKNEDIAYPFHYQEAHAYFATVGQFLKQFLHIHAVKGCDYLEHQGAIVISYYIYEEKSLSNYLLVINQKQEVKFHEKIGSQLEGIGADTFFIVKNGLIFIKEKFQLISYALDNVQ